MQTENEIARQVVDAAFHVHMRLGLGLLESVYQAALVYELSKRQLQLVTEAPIPVHNDGLEMEIGFRADILPD